MIGNPLGNTLGNPLGLKIGGGNGPSIGDIVTRLAPPSGQFLEADGRQLSKAMYSKLYAAIGDAYSAADFSSGFSTVTLSASSTWISIAYGNGLFVAISSAGLTSVSADLGATWQAGGALPAGTWNCITFGAGRFVVVGTGSYSYYSADGTGWIRSTSLPSNVNWNRVAYGGGRFVAIATNNSITAISTTGGESWITGGSLPDAFTWSALCFGDGKFVALAPTYSYAAVSENGGISWSARTLPSTSAWSSVAYGNGVFVAVASNTTIVATSVSGVTWVAAPGSLYASSAIAFGVGSFVGSQAATFMSTLQWSSDAAVWSAVATGAGNITLNAIAFGGGCFVAIGSGSSIGVRRNVYSPTNFNLPALKPGDNRSTAYIKVA